MSDTYCDLDGWSPDTLDQYFESPQRPPLHFFSIDESVPPWKINHITKCGPDVGRFQSMISEEGVPYQKGFENKHMQVGPSWAHSHYMNERLDMAVEAATTDGGVVLHPAGVMGWSHPDPRTIVTLQDLYDRTDRARAARDEDKPKVRANIFNHTWVDPDTGRTRKFVIAAGWVLPSVTRREVIDIENAGISGVTTVVSTVGGVGVEMITADFVRQGRQTAGQRLERTELDAASAITFEVFDFDAADIGLLMIESAASAAHIMDQDITEGPEPMATTQPINFDLSSVEADVEALAEKFEARVDAKVAEAKKELGIVDPPPPPTEADRIAALEGDLARRADKAIAPDFADIGDSALSRLINGAFREDEESRSDFYARIAVDAKIDPDTVRQIVGAQIKCPPIEVLTGIAQELPMTRAELVAAARRDGCTRYGD